MKDLLAGFCVLTAVVFAGAAFYAIVNMVYSEQNRTEPTYYNKGLQDSTETH